ncbi:trigger factor [Anaerolineales bacterium HSG24]|nr:trigger factor [Anaerolineales bacterium HSG24]
MEITNEALERCETLVIAEYSNKEVEKLYQKAARKLSRGYKIPGFRPGKAPYQVVARRLGIDTLRDHALQEDGERMYNKILETSGVEAYGQANLENITWDPLVIKLRLPTAPMVTASNYRDIRLEFEPIRPVTEEEIHTLLAQYQEQNATWVPSDKPAEVGDSVSILVTERDGNTVITDNESADYVLFLSEAANRNPTPDDKFTEALIGLREGEEKEFTITYPKSFSNPMYSGKNITTCIEISGVKVKELDPVDDDLAQTVSDVDTLDELKTMLRTNIEQQREGEQDEVIGKEILHKVIELSEASWSPLFEEQTLQQYFKEQELLLEQRNLRFEDYLEIQKTTKKEWENEARKIIASNLKSSFVVGEIAEQENIYISEQEISSQTQVMLQSMQLDKAGRKQFLESPQTRDTVKITLLSDKVVHFLAQVARGNVPAKASTTDDAVEAEVSDATDEVSADTDVAEVSDTPDVEAASTDEVSADAPDSEKTG